MVLHSSSTTDSDYKENYDTNNSPIRKSTVGPRTASSKQRMLSTSKLAVEMNEQDDSNGVSMLELFSHSVTTNSQIIAQIYTHLQYLKTLKIRPVNLNSVFPPGSGNGNNSSSLNLILRLFAVMNLIHGLNNAINLYNFKHRLVINNCIKLLSTYTTDLSFDNTE